MKIITSFPCSESINKDPMPEFTGEGMKYENTLNTRFFEGQFSPQQILQLVRMQEGGKRNSLSRWKTNVFRGVSGGELSNFAEVIVRRRFLSEWEVRFITWAEAETN